MGLSLRTFKRPGRLQPGKLSFIETLLRLTNIAALIPIPLAGLCTSLAAVVIFFYFYQ
jgi:hypothetical protein